MTASMAPGGAVPGGAVPEAAVPEAAVPGSVDDPAEVERSRAERDQDLAAERRLLVGQLGVVLVVVLVAAALVALGH